MKTATDIARKAVTSALTDIKAAKLSEDALARALISEAISIYRKSRSVSDIGNELEFLAENLAEDEDYNFMRP